MPGLALTIAAAPAKLRFAGRGRSPPRGAGLTGLGDRSGGRSTTGLGVRSASADVAVIVTASVSATEAKADAVIVGASEHAGHRIVGSLAMRLVWAGKWPITVVP